MASSSASSPASPIQRTRASLSGSGLPCPSMRPAASFPRSVSEEKRMTTFEQETVEEPTPQLESVLFEVKKVIVGQEHLLERLMVALLARGHVLVEGVPGLAKTLAIRTLAQTIGGSFQRIQFTPDLVPADLVGTRVYNQKTGDFLTS